MDNGARPTELKVLNAPDDSISRVRFGLNSSQFLLCSAWDCTLRLYDLAKNTMRVSGSVRARSILGSLAFSVTYVFPRFDSHTQSRFSTVRSKIPSMCGVGASTEA